ncbi:hypothetical protein [Roseivirga sp.]|uniref:hypothetical protein n=1 Tax=Roseivirga sp. TaxID=1964215 RepID=UPI003B8CA2C5
MDKNEFVKLEKILGRWNRSNIRPGNSATESWKKISETLYQGVGISMTGSDTTFVEKLRLEVKDNKIYYIADVEENSAPTYFEIVKLTNDGFISENPEHDFPKMIAYSFKRNEMSVIISDGKDKKMGFQFIKP